jgi:hypothetical protein
MPKHKPVTQTPQQIRAMAEELARTASELRLYSDAVEHAGFASLPITGFGQMKLAITFADAYGGAVKAALYKAKQDRGDFAEPPTPAKKRVRSADTNGAK